MQTPQTNHKQPRQPVPLNIETNAKQLEKLEEQINWKKLNRRYWLLVGTVILTVVAFIISIGIANAIVATM